MKTKTLLESALSYQKKGLSVIPVGTNKKPLIQWLKYQTQKATEDQIIKWWKQFPKVNIGIVTGSISDISVLDIDPLNGGKTPKGIPVTLTSKTQSGGWHYYFKYEKDLHNMAGLEQGVDIRSDGGYVIAPPSVGEKGKYKWIVNEDIAPFPQSLLKKAKKYSKKDWEKISSGSSKGDRNMTSAKYIGLLISKFSKNEWNTTVWNTVIGWNKQNKPPLSEQELRIIFNSICTRERERKSILSPMQLTEKTRLKKILCDKFDSKAPLNNMASVCLFFENSSKYKDAIKYNEFRRQIEINKEEFTDKIILEIMKDVQETVIQAVKKETIHQAIQNYSYEHSFDEAVDWLKTLTWDKKPRLESWLITATGVEDDKDKYHRAIGSQWLLALVQRLVYPGCIFDHALVLAGDQGIGKTSLFRIIGGSWYKNFSGALDNNDFYLLLRGAAILDLDEGATLYKTGSAKVKASLSLTYDEFRAPYDRTTQKHFRRFVFSMTTNDAEPLRDTTGNRRYWIADLKEKVDFKWLENNREQLFAEAYYCLMHKIKMPEVPESVAKEKQELHLAQDSWQEPILNFLKQKQEYCDADKNFSTTINIIYDEVVTSPTDSTNGLIRLDKRIEMRIATILKAVGFEKRKEMLDGERKMRWYLSNKKIKELKKNKPGLINF